MNNWTLARRVATTLCAPALVAFAYYLGAEAAFYIGTLSDRIFAPFWPPNMILFCTLLHVPFRRWWIFVAAALPAHIIAEMGVGMLPLQYLVAFATNCTLAVLSAYCVLRWAPGPPWFAQLKQALIYVLIVVVVSPAICAFGGAFVQILGGGTFQNYSSYWANWFCSNALGGATLGPPILAWMSGHRQLLLRCQRRWIETTFLVMGLIVASYVAFELKPSAIDGLLSPTLLYLPVPFIIWGALRYGAMGASTAVLIVALFALWGILRGAVFTTVVGSQEKVLTLQIFLTARVIPALLLGAAVEELQRAKDGLQDLAGSLLRIHDDERRRLTNELHESIGQDLAAAHLASGRLKRADEPLFTSTVDELQTILLRAIDEIRAVSQLLHPPLLDQSGLVLALKSYLRQLSRQNGIDIDLTVSSGVDRLAADAELVLFRVIQDVIESVHHHSGSPSTHITLACVNENPGTKFVVTIEDASGADPDRGSSGPRRLADSQLSPDVSLLGSKERLRRIGGSIHLEGRVGKTVAAVVIPKGHAKP